MATSMLTGPHRRSPLWVVAVVAGGVVLGALLTEIAAWLLPESAAREVFTTAVSASLGPLSLDFDVLAFTIGPLVLNVNVFTVVGILLVGLFARRLL